MTNLHIRVEDKIAKYNRRDGVIVCGNKGYQLVFTFDSEWDDHPIKTARFIWNNTYYDQEFTDNVCQVPVLNDTTEVVVGVYAGDLKTTTPAEIPCLISILCGNPEATDNNVKEYRDLAQVAAVEAKQAAEVAKKAADVVVQPVIKVEPTEGGHKVTVKDIEGDKSFEVLNGGGSGLTKEQLAHFNEIVKWWEDQNYTSMTVSISPSGATYELGSTQKIKFSWEFTKEVSSVTFNGEEQEATQKGSKEVEITYAPETPQNGSFSYVVKGVRKDGKQEEKEAESTINFQNRFYRGYAADPRDTAGGVVNGAFIKSLTTTGTKGFASGRGITFNTMCKEGTYIWYAYPKRFGVAQPSMAPIGSTMYFNGGFEDPIIVTEFENDYNYKEDYYVYRSMNPGLSQTVKMS